MQKIGIDEFLKLAKQHPVLDVRSLGEYTHAHIPGAYNLPLFSDEERKVVGTIYKQEGREQAIKAGLDYFGVKMRRMVEEVEELIDGHGGQMDISVKCVLVHCWRGGMRSAGVAWLLGLYGFKVYTLSGGYKSFRNWTSSQFEKPYSFNIIGGYTGSGKTGTLAALAANGQAVIDLENIACHKGSAFGALGEVPQPTQEMFENILGLELHKVADKLLVGESIWLEDESRRIGNVNIPGALLETMRLASLYFLEVPFEERLTNIAESYGKFQKEELVSSVMRIQKRLGGLDTKNAVSNIMDENYKEAFRILLHYYDKYYGRDLSNRDKPGGMLLKIICEDADAITNSKKVLKQLSDGITNAGH